jgi:hypothetical protein
VTSTTTQTKPLVTLKELPSDPHGPVPHTGRATAGALTITIQSHQEIARYRAITKM